MTKTILIAALAAAVAAPGFAQASDSDLTYATPIAGAWRYTPTSSGSEATFATPAGAPQVIIRCTHAGRQLAILKPAAAASTTLWVWTSVQSRSLPATFDAATARVTAGFTLLDPIGDAMASSRGRLGFSTAGAAPLVVPAAGEIARVIEDCRA